jgi:hypothetical protein
MASLEFKSAGWQVVPPELETDLISAGLGLRPRNLEIAVLTCSINPLAGFHCRALPGMHPQEQKSKCQAGLDFFPRRIVYY